MNFVDKDDDHAIENPRTFLKVRGFFYLATFQQFFYRQKGREWMVNLLISLSNCNKVCIY